MWKKLLFKYKSEQGLLVRGSGLGVIAALLAFGCWGLYFWLAAKGTFFKEPVGGIVVPLVDLTINGALIVTLALFCAGVLATAHIIGKPRTADLLIETESELQKVTWPSWPETVNASIIVIFATLLMAGILFLFDVVLGWLTGLIL
jgi:preprotein translocase subunit SecE